MITRNTGADIIPFAPRPLYPGARIRAVQDAQERREREAARPFDADRLRDDIRALDDPRNWSEGHGGDLATELRRRGWNDERLDAAQAALRDDLRRRVHPPAPPPVTVAATAPSPPGRAGHASSIVATATSPGSTARDRRGAARNIAAVLAMGLDPSTLWPGQLGLPGKPTASWAANSPRNRLANRAVEADQDPLDPPRDRLTRPTSQSREGWAWRATRGRTGRE